eukprot:2446019-Amphidinium_carterae.1
MDTVFAVVCCRHTRFTPGIGSWNPTGYYPRLECMPKKVLLQERWQDEDNIIPNHWIPYDSIWGDQEASSSDPES